MRCLPTHTSPSRTGPELEGALERAQERAQPSGTAAMQARTLSEVFATTASDGGVAGFVMAALPATPAPILWVQDQMSLTETGRPYLPGLSGRHAVIHIALGRATDVLWAMEEGLRCASLCAVIGEVWGAPPSLDFTATRRLAVRAEASHLPCWLLRRAATPDLSAARNRWRITSLPSRPHPYDPQAPGDPRWQVDLFRTRQGAPGTWVATHDRAADRVDFSAPVRDGTLAEDDGADLRRAAR